MASPSIEPDEPRDARVEADVPYARRSDVDTLFEQVVAQTLDEKPAPRASLTRSTTALRRAALLVATAILSSLSLGLQGLRPDLSSLGPAASSALLLLFTAALVSAASALRPMFRPPERWPWLLSLLLVALFGLSLLAAWPGMQETPEPALRVHLGCGLMTALFSALASRLTWSLDRADRIAPWRIARAAAASALFAFALQLIACPVTEPLHLAIAHALPGALAAAGLVGIAIVRR